MRTEKNKKEVVKQLEKKKPLVLTSTGGCLEKKMYAMLKAENNLI